MGLSHNGRKYPFSSYPPTCLSHPTAAIPNPALMLSQCRIVPWCSAVEHLSICPSVSQRRSPDRSGELPLPTEPASTHALSQLKPPPGCKQPQEPVRPWTRYWRGTVPQRWAGMGHVPSRDSKLKQLHRVTSPSYRLPPPATLSGYGDKQGWSPLSHRWHCRTCTHIASTLPGSWTPTSIPASPAGSGGMGLCPAFTPQHCSPCPGTSPGPSAHQRFVWDCVDEPGRMRPFPTARLHQHGTLPALRLPARLPQPRSSSPLGLQPEPIVTPRAKAVQGQAQPALGTQVPLKPPNFSLLQKSRFCTKIPFCKRASKPHSCPKRRLGQDCTSFHALHPKTGLGSVCSPSAQHTPPHEPTERGQRAERPFAAP